MQSSYIQLQRSENIRLAILTLYKGSPAGNVTDISALVSAEILLFLYLGISIWKQEFGEIYEKTRLDFMTTYNTIIGIA